MITRYFFSQFWCEFTKDVLTEFINEDFLIKEMQAEAAEKKKVQNLQNIQQQLLSNHQDIEDDELDFVNNDKRSNKDENNYENQMAIISFKQDGSVKLSSRAHRQIDRFQALSMSNTPRIKLVRNFANDPILSDRPGNVITSLVENNTVIVDDKMQEEILMPPFSKVESTNMAVD